MNRSRPYGEHEYSESEAQRKFLSSHRERDIDEDCPECGSSEFAYWNSNVAMKADYDYCPACGFGRAYMPTG